VLPNTARSSWPSKSILAKTPVVYRSPMTPGVRGETKLLFLWPFLLLWQKLASSGLVGGCTR
jgi:hypothetical protein